MTEHLPDEITYGFVADRVLLAVGDTNRDFDRFPDGVPAQGTVRFSPERTILYTQQHPATVLPQDIECTIYHRDHPVAKEQGYEPELVGKLVDPAGHVGNVALIVGWYEVVYRLSTGTAQRFRFQVRPEHTAENPLWLPEVAPLQPTPSERFVVNEQVYNDTKAARDDAVEAAQDAVEARDLVLPARDQTLAARDETLAHGIRVDTSVGTRVFVGNTMIYGDTGWRDISDSGWQNGWSGKAHIRRVGSTVELKFSELAHNNATSPTMYSRVMMGFHTEVGSLTGLLVTSPAASNYETDIIRSSGSLNSFWRGPDSNPSVDGRAFSTVVFFTEQAWPSSLPGTPA